MAGAWMWIAVHLLMVLVTYVRGMPRIENGFDLYHEASPSVDEMFSRWRQFDTNQYLLIAEDGYGNPPTTKAFYPLYPLLIRIFHLFVPGDMFAAAMAVSSVAAFATFVLLHQLVTFELGEALAARTLFYFAAFPFSLFLSVGYNESLFLSFAFGSLYAARRARWWPAGALAGLASGTRSAGVLLGVAIAFEYLRRREFRLRSIRLDVLSLALVPSGLLAFAAYCWSRFDNPLEFSEAQAAWGRELTMPWDTLWTAAKILNDRPAMHPLTVYHAFDFTVTIAAAIVLVLATVGPWRLRPDQAYLMIYGWLSLALMLLFPVSPPVPMASFPRYVIELLPVFMILAKLGERRWFEWCYLMPAIGMQGIWMTLYVNYLWAG